MLLLRGPDARRIRRLRSKGPPTYSSVTTAIVLSREVPCYVYKNLLTKILSGYLFCRN